MLYKFGIDFTSKNSDQDAINLFAEQLTSSNPNLTPEAIEEIKEIERHRLSVLSGTNLYEAHCFFEHLSRLPPIEGRLVFKCLKTVLLNNFNLMALLDEAEQNADTSETSSQEANEYGYIETTCRLAPDTSQEETVNSDSLQNFSISIDIQGAESKALYDVLPLLISHLRNIDSDQIRNDLLGDLRAIIDLRLSIQV